MAVCTCGRAMDKLPDTIDVTKYQCQECFWKTCKVGGHFELTRGQMMDRAGGTTRGEDRKPGWGGK